MHSICQKNLRKRLGDFVRRMGSTGLECPNNAKELSECSYIHFREVVLPELAEMTVVADDVGCSGDDSTIDKFIVVGVGLDEVEAVGGVNMLHVGCIGNSLYDKGRKLTVTSHMH